MTVVALPHPLTPALAERLAGRHLMLFLDVDGTLAPIAPSPADAVVPNDTRSILRALVGKQNVVVAAVSGRGVDDVRRMLDVDRIWVIGNHGMELGTPGRPAEPRSDVAKFGGVIAIAASRAESALARRRGVIVENKRWTLSVHYRLARRDDVAGITATTNEIARELGLRVTQGKEVLELRPPVQTDKGIASIELAEGLGAFSGDTSLLCVGDDRTDEDLFRALRARAPNTVSVRVGRGDAVELTHAEFLVGGPDAVRELLAAVLALRP